MNKFLNDCNILIGKVLSKDDTTLVCEGFNLNKDQINFSLPIVEQVKGGLDVKLEHSVGDIILYSNYLISTLYYSKSKHNALFLTEKCNNNCLMCSQPPINDENTDSLFVINNLLLELLPKDIETIGITGGEPTLFYNQLILLLERTLQILPDVSIHILSNGRSFNDFEKVSQLASLNKANIVVGIPLHSDIFFEHDFITQVKGSFNQTMKGLYNLTSYGIRIEIRIVINKQNYRRLDNISDFVYKNLPFVEHIAFMGLEYIGNAMDNYGLIEVSPYDYMEELASSILKLKRWGLNASVYNVPLCMLKPTIFEFAKKSISDWKQKYSDECDQCVLKNNCCGLFATSITNPKVTPFN